MSREELKPCPLCAGSVSFHQDDLDCPDGCHHLVCSQCKSFFDLSCCADPNNETDTLDELRDRIAPIWNRRAQAEQQGDNPPFANCSFRICDLPGQCRGEGKCHHPKAEQQGDDSLAFKYGNAIVDRKLDSSYEQQREFCQENCECSRSFDKPVCDYATRKTEQQGDGGAISKEWCMRMAALEGDSDIPPAGAAALSEQPSARVALSEALKKSIVRITIGFCWNPGEIQTVNGDDLMRLVDAILAASAAQGGKS